MIEWVVGLVVISVRDVSPTIGVYVCALRVWVRARACFKLDARPKPPSPARWGDAYASSAHRLTHYSVQRFDTARAHTQLTWRKFLHVLHDACSVKLLASSATNSTQFIHTAYCA